MTKVVAILAAVVVIAVPPIAKADLLSCSAGACSVSTTGLRQLDEDTAWTWDITTPSLTGQQITGASLTFSNIKNVDYGSNTLNIYLLNTAGLNVKEVTSHEIGDYFTGTPTWSISNISSTPTNLVFNFTASELTTLASYIATGNDFAFGIDPDCHFEDTTVTFKMNTDPASVPEPSSILLLGTLVVAITVGLRRHLA